MTFSEEIKIKLRNLVDSIQNILDMLDDGDSKNMYNLDMPAVNAKFKFPREINIIIDGVKAFLEEKDAIFSKYKPLVNPYAFALAVRHQESGRAGLEFGIMNQAARVDIHTQLNWFLWTFMRDTERWSRDTLINVGGKKVKDFTDFTHYFANKYCPSDGSATNDPTGLNKHWLPNVRKFYADYNG